MQIVRAIVLAGLLGPAGASAQSTQYERIDCAETKLTTTLRNPTCQMRTLIFSYNNLETGRGRTYNTFSSAGGVWGNFVYMTTPNAGSWISNMQDPGLLTTLREFSPTTRDESTDWGQLEPGPAGTRMVRFKDKGGRNCAMINQWGPLNGNGYAWRL